MGCIHSQRLESAAIKMIANMWSLEPDVSMQTVEAMPSKLIVNTGEHSDGQEFIVNLYCGHSAEKVELPSIVAYASPTTEDEPGNGLWNVELHVQLQVPADNDDGQETTFKKLNRFSTWLATAMNATDLHVDLTISGGDLSVLGAWGRSAAVSVEGRRRQHTYSIQTLVSLYNL